MKCFFLFTLVLASVFAHNWLITPPTYDGNVANQNTPCDTGNLATAFSVQQTRSGGSIAATWTVNHGTIAPNILYLVPQSLESSLESLTPTSSGVVAYYSDQTTLGAGTISWSSAVSPGTYILQYRWETWRNCAPIQMLAPLPNGAQPISGEANQYTIPHGTFNAATGQMSCDTGWTVSTSQNACVLNPAAAFFLAVFIILIVLVIVIVVLVVLRRFGVLPQSVANVVEKGENKLLCKKSASTSTSPTNA
jgi:hypothetical protein